MIEANRDTPQTPTQTRYVCSRLFIARLRRNSLINVVRITLLEVAFEDYCLAAIDLHARAVLMSLVYHVYRGLARDSVGFTERNHHASSFTAFIQSIQSIL